MRKITILGAALCAMLTTPALAGSFFGGGEDSAKSSDVQIAQQMNRLLDQANKSVPLPAIINFFEKRMVTMLYEMRDDPNFRTHTYIVTMTGKFVKICDSVGFGINASIQLSNPMKPVDLEDILGNREGNSQTLMPQAEPNGLFMPEGLAATYVMCVVPGKEDLAPVYVEPDVVVSPFELVNK